MNITLINLSTSLRQSQRSRRQGLSLIEVLISMFVLAVGLLGVASLLPVGQIQIARGEIEEQKRHVADAAFGVIQAGGWLNPSRWLTASQEYFDAVNPQSESRILFPASGSSTASTIESSPLSEATSLEFDDFEDCVLEFRKGNLRGIRRRVTGQGTDAPYTTAPFSAPPSAGDTFVIFRNEPFAIDPLFVAHNGGSDFAGSGASTPMRRITVTAGPGGYPYTEALADHFCISRDDLSIVIGDDPDTAAIEGIDEVSQRYYRATDESRLKRKTDGQYSWLATFVPQLPDPGSDQQAYASDVNYTVSVAVYKNRLYRGTAALDDESHQVSLTFTGGGYGGGRATASGSAPSLEKLKVGEWILVWNTNASTRTYAWYEVQAVLPLNNGTRDVRLAGPDWNTTQWESAAAKICVGCVGVYSRSLQVERLPER